MPAPYVDPVAIRRLTDDGGYRRGTSYQRSGMVTRTSWDDAEHVLTSVVAGSAEHTYRCAIRFSAAGVTATVASTSCSCPVPQACKHVVATLLVSNDDAVMAAAVAPDRPSPPAWRILVPAASADTTTPIALGVELRQRAHSEAHHWSPRPVRPVTARELAKGTGELLLGIRPLMRSAASGAWIQGDVSWDSVRRSAGVFGRERVRWFADLLSLSRDSLLSGTAGDWLAMDLIESSLLWGHLRQGRALGIELISTQKSTTVSLGDAAVLSAALTRLDDGSLSVAAEVVVDERAVPTASVRAIGHSGVYVAESIGSRIALTLAEVELSEPVHALLKAQGAITVSKPDEAAFLREAYPALARRAPIRTIGRVKLPAVPQPQPTLVVTFRTGDTIDYTFEWTYRGFGRFPLSSTSDAVRDDGAERERQRELEQLWSELSDSIFAASGTFHDVDAAEFVAHVVPAFQAQGVSVVENGTRKDYQELTGTPEITVSTVESTDADWFDLGVLVKIDGRTIPFTPLFKAMTKGRRKLLLVDGSYLSLNHPALDRLRELIDEASELQEWETGPRISRYQTDLWEEFEDLADEALPAVSWRATAEGLRQATEVPTTPVPAGLRAELRPYQKDGFDWLAFLWAHRLGGILADDMGLGKTIQLLSLALHAKETGEKRPFLVVAPTSVLGSWQREAARFAPGLRVRVIDSSSVKRDAMADAAQNADVVITSYTLVRLDEREFAETQWAGLILDEAQFVKNPKTKQHRAVAALHADVVYAVSGTPMENSLTDLWALLKLAAPGLFASARKFGEDYVQPIEKGKVPENEEGGEYRQRRLERLRRRIRPLMLRRTKQLVAADLPEKQEQHLHVELSPAHRALYDTVLQRERQKVLGLLKDLDRNRFIVFRSLTMLRLLSLSPGLVDPEDAKIGSRKLDALLEHLQELQAEGHRALVFSQFTSYLQEAAARLDQAGIAYAYLDGSTRSRPQVIDGFRAGEQPVFLISLKAGGFGLTLTEADYVFLLDPWWNPAAEAQAVDRTHRIGQQKPVMVYRMISSGTIEEKVLALQERKARLFTAVMDDEEMFAQSLTADDIRGLFES
ncbi:DEAD/DEAH box helicase [Microbacterium sp. AK031]|uniref:DEAD/DEAH box helicase n=1 Tax=Microbacterium sp. AK031 TaxID=2723076 RepID=UPI00216AAB69|nr:DEAD/DEAH box helicase [Microbacterium sp. AK031]MCS3842533.1 superfamily II DNA or RNA helicase [Microbacterium sp. AK031]